MDDATFRERLLDILEQKHHWAWPSFTNGEVAADALHLHLEQEYATYVRDFPVLIGRCYVNCPIPEVRQELAENLYEEETGGLVAGTPHPELFLLVPRGLGMDMARFENVDLLPGAQAYRQFLDEVTLDGCWEVATAIVTLFVEGNRYERSVLDPSAPRRPEPPLESHPLVVHYGLAVEQLALTRAHRQVEGDHRISAWRCVLGHVHGPVREEIVTRLSTCLTLWKEYRTDVAVACGIQRP
ncbi:MAG: iron-containing redox enzyme family protein [Myxococcota bacterium]|nr:iron-containing redox enzyme family protein [Myxococcota bacterium]